MHFWVLDSFSLLFNTIGNIISSSMSNHVVWNKITYDVKPYCVMAQYLLVSCALTYTAISLCNNFSQPFWNTWHQGYCNHNLESCTYQYRWNVTVTSGILTLMHYSILGLSQQTKTHLFVHENTHVKPIYCCSNGLCLMIWPIMVP